MRKTRSISDSEGTAGCVCHTCPRGGQPLTRWGPQPEAKSCTSCSPPPPPLNLLKFPSSFEVHVRSFLMNLPFDDTFYLKQRYSVWDCFLTPVFSIQLASTQRLSHRFLLFSLCAQTALGS